MILNFRDSFIYLRLLPLLALIAAGNAYSQPEDPATGFADHSLLAGFSDSEITARLLARDINYTIVLGGLQRTRGEVIPENSERLRGDVTKITYEVSQEFTADDVYQYFREQLESRNYSELFSCEGRACGSSNYWANDIFRNRILYGPERNQFYLAFRTNRGTETEVYFALYIITRANRKIYAHVEIVEPGGTQEPEQQAPQVISRQLESANPESSGSADAALQAADLIRQLQQRGSIILPDIGFQSDNQLAQNTDLSLIVSLLNLDRSVLVYLVSHLNEESQALQMLMQRSNTRANTLRQALITEGIEASRIIAAGVGPLAPSCDGINCEQRIELVLR